MFIFRMIAVRNRVILSGMVAAGVFFCQPAHASRRFPAAIEKDLHLSYAPPCSLCHVKGNVGPGTAETPFALSMRARGMVSGNTSMLSSALGVLQQDRADSDGDGVTDIDELVAGTDPNTPAPSELQGRRDPSYGCAGGQQATRAPMPIIFIAAAIAFGRRRRNRA